MVDSVQAPESSPISPPAGAPTPPDLALLDNPIWNSLSTDHSKLAMSNSLARRFPPSIGPLSGMAHYDVASYDALRQLAGPGGVVGLFLEQPYVAQPGWELLRDGQMYQMIHSEPSETPLQSTTPGVETAQDSSAEIVQLTAADSPAMLALARLTEPGPFFERTHELGTFFGIWSNGRLMAMAGERLRFPKFVEVSAVCTHPEARGRGYGSALTRTVAQHIRSNGKTPMLHLFAANQAAFRVYLSLGFTVRRTLELAFLKSEG
jgi:GNAT superfamily N-acetyltransferase